MIKPSSRVFEPQSRANCKLSQSKICLTRCCCNTRVKHALSVWHHVPVCALPEHYPSHICLSKPMYAFVSMLCACGYTGDLQGLGGISKSASCSSLTSPIALFCLAGSFPLYWHRCSSCSSCTEAPKHSMQLVQMSGCDSSVCVCCCAL